MPVPATVGLVIVAGGSGTRLGFAQPKAFVPLDGEALLSHCLRRLAPHADRTVVVVPAGHVDAARTLLADMAPPLDPAAQVVVGGDTRTQSVAAGLAVLPDTDVVAIHDAARPLADGDVLRRAVAAIQDGADAVAPALPVSDTLKEVAPAAPDAAEQVLRTVDRSTLRAVQTPQVFRRRALVEAHQRDAGGATDDLALVERAGGVVRLVAGHARLHKITYPEDLRILHAMLHDEMTGAV